MTTSKQDSNSSNTAENAIADDIRRYTKNQIKAAGQRYTPQIKSGAPNLEIKDVTEAIDNLIAGPNAWNKLESWLSSTESHWRKVSGDCQNADDIQRLIDELKAELPKLIKKCQEQDESAAIRWISLIAQIAKTLRVNLDHWEEKRKELRSLDNDERLFSQINEVGGKCTRLARLCNAVNEAEHYAHTGSFRLLYSPQLLLSGEWGSGKTHSLCDAALKCIHNHHPVLLILAKTYRDALNSSIPASISSRGDIDDILNSISKQTAKSQGRGLLILDGIDEARSDQMKEFVKKIRAKAARKQIGLIVSCRKPFEGQFLNKSDLQKLIRLDHPGFEQLTTAARDEYFSFYKIPGIEVPHLHEECAKPLSLKYLCEALSELPKKELKKGFSGIASGQKGMTFILEHLIDKMGERIESKYGLRDGTCWEIIKGGEKKYSGIAACMAHGLRDCISIPEAKRVIKTNLPPEKHHTHKHILEDMKFAGLLFEDEIFIESKNGPESRRVVRLPYQRFSDHIIARNLLLNPRFDPSTDKSIKRSFSLKSKLGKLFKVVDGEYAMPGLAQAIIAEYPIRAGQKLNGVKKELYYILPKRARSATAYFAPFKAGLQWRNKEAYSEGTKRLVAHYLKPESDTYDGMVDAILAICTKPDFEFNSKWLYDFLESQDLPTRDLSWSKYLCANDDGSAASRYLRMLRRGQINADKKFLVHHIALLAILLTTPTQSDRDIITKSLVCIGETEYETLFERTLRSLEFRDPCVNERMLAACYGVSLSQGSSNSEFRPALRRLAQALYNQMFRPGSRHCTYHALTRDHALCIIKLSRRINAWDIPEAEIREAEKTWPVQEKTGKQPDRPEAISENTAGILSWEFEREALKLMQADSEFDLEPMKRSIEERIYTLGYRKQRFANAERTITLNRKQVGPGASIGKFSQKYAWIAFHETWGQRDSAKKLRPYRIGKRSPCHEIDPSFPEEPGLWHMQNIDFWGDTSQPTSEWIHRNEPINWSNALSNRDEVNNTEWVLLYGYLSASHSLSNRSLFAFLQSVLTYKHDTKRLIKSFETVDYPGNSQVPDLLSQHAVYFGEAGQTDVFADELIAGNGRYKPQLARAFENNSFSRHLPESRFVNVEIPAVRLTTDIRSETLPFSECYFPAPRLIEKLGLHRRGRSVNFFDISDRQATNYRCSKPDNDGMRYNLLYIRRDLIEAYLFKSRKALVWLNWGERNFKSTSDMVNLGGTSPSGNSMPPFCNIHRSSEVLGRPNLSA